MICNFCYRHCDIKEGNFGFCGVRQVKNNKLISPNYGLLESIAIDPVEKKPLYHFLPGSKTLSVAEVGCNFRCHFCQNWQLSQAKQSLNNQYMSPKNLVNLALEYKVPSISFTYSEPIVWQDYVIDTAKIAKQNNLKTIMVTNGSFSKEARESLSPLIDAFNIDLKGDSNYYKEICIGNIEPVLEGIKYLIEAKNHVEVTTLLIEGIHTRKIVDNIAKTLKTCGVKVWHLSRFFPNYKMNDFNATSENFLSEMVNIAKNNGIDFVYGGNTKLPTPTICPNCKEILISDHISSSYIKNNLKIENGKCKFCGTKIYGLF